MFGEGGTDGGTDNSIWVLAGDREEGGPGKGCRAWRGTVLAARPGHTAGPRPAGTALAALSAQEGGSGRLRSPGATERLLESVGAKTHGQGMREHGLTAQRGAGVSLRPAAASPHHDFIPPESSPGRAGGSSCPHTDPRIVLPTH